MYVIYFSNFTFDFRVLFYITYPFSVIAANRGFASSLPFRQTVKTPNFALILLGFDFSIL